MDTSKALKTVTTLCSKKEYCRQEIRQKLEKWEIAEKDIDKTFKIPPAWLGSV